MPWPILFLGVMVQPVSFVDSQLPSLQRKFNDKKVQVVAALMDNGYFNIGRRPSEADSEEAVGYPHRRQDRQLTAEASSESDWHSVSGVLRV